jgi:TP901 family phage tail tape measure protein
MAVNLGIKTTFTAIDKFTNVVNKMTASTKGFANKAVTAFHRVERAERKLRQGLSRSLGVFGKLGVAISGLAIATTIGAANVELDKNMASLSAITGVTGEKFNEFGKQIEIVSKKQKKFAGETAKSFEIVGSVKPELLKNAKALSNVTENVIILSKATGTDLETSAKDLTGTLNQFNLTSEHSARVMNALAAGSQAGAATVPDITASIKQFGAVAGNMNISVEESIGLIETLAEKNIKGAESGTKIRNILTKVATIKGLPKAATDELIRLGVNMNIVSDNSIPMNKRLKELSKISNDATALVKVFGTENMVAGQILLQNVDKVTSYTKAVTGTNTAVEQANINSNTLSNLWEEMIASFKNAVTSTNSENKALNFLKNTLKWVANNMETFVNIAAIGLGVFVAYKVAMTAFRAIMIAYNVVQGIATAAQWAFNAAMWANPITWIVAIILILIAVIALLIIYWEDIVDWVQTSDSWFAKFIRFAIYPLIHLFKVLGAVFDWIGEKFDKLSNWLRTSDHWFARLMRRITKFTVKSIQWFTKFIEKALKPVKKFFGDIGDLLGGIFDFFSSETQKEMGVNINKKVNTDETVNPDATKKEADKSIQEKVMAKLGIDINDKTGQANISKNTGGIPVNLTKTLGWQ